MKDARSARAGRAAGAGPLSTSSGPTSPAGSKLAGDRLHEEEIESRWEAAPVVAFMIAAQVLLAFRSQEQGWQLWIFPWWVWLVPTIPETILMVPLTLDRPRRRLEQLGMRRSFALVLLALTSVANGFLVLALVASLLSGFEHDGAELLVKAIAVWGSNVISFGLWFWALDRGGPVRRLRHDELDPDFFFPQMDEPRYAPPDWHPRLFDYLYISFTNSIAFSPTDVLPLSHAAKVLMLVESAVSAVTLLLLAARAVNILG
jgi:hypothetical protein